MDGRRVSGRRRRIAGGLPCLQAKRDAVLATCCVFQ
jgi:hypothetical protein